MRKRREWFLVAALLFASMIGSCAMALASSPPTIQEMMWTHMRWLNIHSDLPLPSELPQVQYVSKDTLQIWYYGPEYVAAEEAQGRTVSDIVAIYDPEKNTVVLPVGYDYLDLATASHLVHELVHYMQDVRGDFETTKCTAGLEPLAYKLHNKWIDDFHSPEPHTDPLFLLFLETACDPSKSSW